MKNFTLFTFLFFIFTSFFSVQLNAQISITSNDFKATFLQDAEFPTYLDTVTAQVDVGSSGESMVDFSGLVSSFDYKTINKEVSETPYDSDFPDAQYATYHESDFDTIIVETWSYFSINDSFRVHGSVALGTASYGTSETIISYDPAWKEYGFPLNYLDTYSDSITQVQKTTMTYPGLPQNVNTYELKMKVTKTIDGYGTMTLPGGKQVDFLRIVEVTTLTQNFMESVSTEIVFLTKTGEMVAISLENNDETSGVVEISGASWSGGSGGMTDETPEAPTDLSVTAGTESIDLMWTDNSDNETGFIIERSEGGGNSLVAEESNSSNDFIVLDSVDADVETFSDTEVSTNVEYTYRVSAYNGEMRSQYSETASTTIVATAAVILQNSEDGFSLGQNYPNPFSTNTVISFKLPKDDQVVLSILNVEGKRLKVLLHEEMAKGEYYVDFNAGGLENGVYFYQIRTKEFLESKRMLIVK